MKPLIQYQRAAVFQQSGVAWQVSKTPEPAYSTQQVDADTFHRDLHPDLAATDYRWAFQRGDACIVTYFDEHIVGWDFSTTQDTRVVDGVMFQVPPGHYYAFASLTHAAHRGLGLADQRSTWWQEHGDDNNSVSVWYIATSNQASMAAFGSDHDGVDLIGYTGFLRLGKRSFCWRDSACGPPLEASSREASSR